RRSANIRATCRLPAGARRAAAEDTHLVEIGAGVGSERERNSWDRRSAHETGSVKKAWQVVSARVMFGVRLRTIGAVGVLLPPVYFLAQLLVMAIKIRVAGMGWDLESDEPLRDSSLPMEPQANACLQRTALRAAAEARYR